MPIFPGIDTTITESRISRWLGPGLVGAFPILAYLYFLYRYHSHGYALAGLGALALYFARCARTEFPYPASLGKPAFVTLGAALAALGLIQFLAGGDLGDLDQAFYSNAFWNFRNGHLRYAYAGMNVLGIHALYLSAAFWTPLHAWLGESGLKLCGDACLIAAAWLSIRRYAPRGRAAWGALALLGGPALASQFFFGFHVEVIGAPLLILAMDAYRQARLGRFLALVAALAFCKEAYTLAIAGILILALLERRPWKWIAWPALVLCLQMILYWYVVVPAFAPAGNFLRAFFPASPAGVIALWFRPETADFAFRSLLPFLPVLAVLPRRYWVLPIPLILFYAAFPDPLFRISWQHYNFPIALCCWGGVVLHEGGSAEAGAKAVLSPALARAFAACALTALLSYPLWREVQAIPAGVFAKMSLAREVAARVPDSSSILVNSGTTSRFAARDSMAIWGSRSVWGRRPAPPEAYEYVLLDGRFHPPWLTDPDDLREGIQALSNSPLWITEYARDSVFLFRKRMGPDGSEVGSR